MNDIVRPVFVVAGAVATIYTFGLIMRFWSLGDVTSDFAFLAGWGASALSTEGYRAFCRRHIISDV